MSAAWRFIAIAVFALVLALTILVHTGILDTGFSGKTLWEWLEVFGIPIAVVIIAGAFGLAARGRERRTEEERERDIDLAHEATLHAYLDDMTTLVLDHKLQHSEEGSPERAVAQAHTLRVLKTLDARRKGVIVQFLKDSRLIDREKRIISLHLADLTSSSLSSADLSGTNLSGASLSDADLRNANLRNADLSSTVLTRADLTDADLRDVDLHNADLTNAFVTKEQLNSASNMSGILSSEE